MHRSIWIELMVTPPYITIKRKQMAQFLLSPNGVQLFPVSSGYKKKTPSPMVSYLNFCGRRWDSDPRTTTQQGEQSLPADGVQWYDAVLLANPIFLLFIRICPYIIFLFLSRHSHTDSFILGLPTAALPYHAATRYGYWNC